jgi:hypothetical protein
MSQQPIGGRKMAFKDIIRKGTEGLTDVAMDKISELLDEYKKAIKFLETFGFTVEKLTVSMALFPEVKTSISGLIEDIHEAELKKMIEEHKGEALLVSLLKALIVTRQIWEHVELKLKGFTLNVTLGASPKINVEVK